MFSIIGLQTERSHSELKETSQPSVSGDERWLCTVLKAVAAVSILFLVTAHRGAPSARLVSLHIRPQLFVRHPLSQRAKSKEVKGHTATTCACLSDLPP